MVFDKDKFIEVCREFGIGDLTVGHRKITDHSLDKEHQNVEDNDLIQLKAEIYEKQGKDEKANTLRIAHYRYCELDSTDD